MFSEFLATIPYALLLIVSNVIIYLLIIKNKKASLLITFISEILITAVIMVTIVAMENRISSQKVFTMIHNHFGSFVRSISLYVVLIVVTINLFGLLFGLLTKKSIDPNNSTTHNVSLNYKAAILTCITSIVIMTILILPFSILAAGQKKDYNVIIETTHSNTSEAFSFNNRYYVVYIIAYENQNNYILKPLIKKKKKLLIELNVEKFVSKEDIKTYYVDDVFDEKQIINTIKEKFLIL